MGLPSPYPSATAQDATESADAAKESVAAERFLQVLVRRPRPGTALDRVYGYHVQAGSLDELEAKLKSDGQSPAERGANLMLCGLLQLQRGNDAAAAESLAQAESLRTDDAMTSFYLGKALMLIGKTDAAAEAFKRSIDRKPEKSEALPVFTALGRLYSRSQQTDKALAVWKQLEATFPGDVRVGEQIARTLAEEGQNDVALERYQALAKQATSSDEARAVGYTIEAAEIKRRLGRHDEALKDFETLLAKLRPSSWLYVDVRRRIENGFLRTGDYAALADYYAKQIEQTPDNLELRLRLGHSLSKAGRLNDAEAALEAATKLAPENIDARLALIEIYRAAGKPTKVAEQLEVLIKQEPNNPDYYVRLGNSWLDDRTLDKEVRNKNAETAWQRLADLRKDDAVVLSQVADLMRRIELTDKVIALYERAIEIAPDQPQYREYLGEFLHRQNRKEEALNVWTGIAADSRANRDNYVRLGEVLLTFEYPDKSLDAFAEAAKLDPTFAQRLRYAELLSRAEKHDESLTQLDLAEPIADSVDEQEQLLAARIRVYSNSGTLDKQIEEAAKLCETSDDAQDYRRLALMYDAAARTVDATIAIQAAIKRDPKNVSALTLAADLYRKASRYADAVDTYRELVKLDARFLSNYLKQIAALQMQLGQVDVAMATAEELIAAQPGNPESYRVYAQQCFTLGRDDEGIEKLRRALQAAPRDADAKRALASALADHFRTDEAIELNWQLLAETEEQKAKESIASTLASLYERKGDFDRLVERLELRGRESSNMREAILLTSAAYRATSDFGGARAVLEPLLVDNPRDAELLGQMVTLSESAGEPEVALEYQRQVVNLADTPEQQSRLFNLLIASGELDAADAAVQRLQSIDDPLLVLKMLDRAFSQNDMDLMVKLCQQAIAQRSNLWEARIRLVMALLSEGKYDEALAEADRFDALKLADDELSEVAKDHAKQSAGRAQNATQTTARVTSNRNANLVYSQSPYELASMFRLGPYANSRSSMRPTIFNLNNAGEAKSLLRGLRFVASIKQDKTDEFLKQFPSLQDIEQIDDLHALRAALDISRLKTVFLAQRNSQGRLQANDETAEKVMWQMAKLDQVNRKPMLEQLLMMRMQKRFPAGLDSEEAKDVPPLKEDQFSLLLDAFKNPTTDQPFNQAASQSFYSLISLQKELQAAGRNQEAEALMISLSVEPKTLAQFTQTLRREFALKGAEGLAAQIEKITGRFPDLIRSATAMERTEAMQTLPSLVASTKMPIETKLKIIDLVMALNVDQRPTAARVVNRNRTGQVSTYYRGTNISYNTSKEVAVPFSSQLLSESLVRQIHQSLPLTARSDDQAAWLKHLEQDATIYPAGTPQARAELKSRKVLLAFSKWWVEDLDGAAAVLDELANQWPEDSDLAIERARLAAELDRPEEALAALEQINAVDQQTLQIRELAALSLSASLGKMERGKIAAQRLFGMRLDTATEMTLADQMMRLGMNDLAKAVLQRSQRRGGQQVQDLLQIANRYLSAKENELAAEVAYKALRQLSATTNSNDSYYRQQIVRVLTQAKRLDALLKQAEQRVASAPKSMSLKMQLAELYTAAGRSADADKLFEEVAAQKPNDPKTMWQTATRLASAGKHQEAVDLYLTAIEKDPTVLQQDYYRLINVMQRLESTDKVYERLAAMPLNKFDSYVLSNLTDYRRSGRSTPSESYLKFIDKVLLESSPDALPQVLQSVARQPEVQKRQSMRDVLTKLASSDEFYQQNNSFWEPNSYSSGGYLNGAFEPCLDLLKANDDLRQTVREQATKRLESNETAPIAKLLLLTIDVDDKLDKASALIQFQQLLDSKEAYEGIPGKLWWQVAQRLEKTVGYENMAVTILEKIQVRDDVVDRGMESAYTVSAKLADAYVTAKQKEKAREQLLKQFHAPWDASRYAGNPGYEEYQRISLAQNVARKLTSVDAKTDAIAIYSNLLAKPEMFAAAKTWGGSQKSQQEFEKSQQSLIEKLSEADCLDFVVKRLETRASQEVTPPADAKAVPALSMVPFQPALANRLNAGSLAMLAVDKLAGSESGKRSLVELATKLQQRQAESPDDWSIAAMRVMLAIALKQDDSVSQLDELGKQLASIDLSATKRESRYQCLLACLQPTMMALASEDKGLKQSGEVLVKAIRTRAEAEKLPAVMQVASMVLLNGASSGTGKAESRAALMTMLDAIAPVKDATAEPAVVSTTVANECLRVAEVCTETKQWSVMFEALKRGFGGGVPLLTNENSGRTTRGVFIAPSAQIIQAMNSSRSEDLSQYIDRIANLFKKLEATLREQSDPESALAAYRTLQQMVLPESRPKEVFLYLPELSRSPGDTENISAILVKFATLAGQSETLRQLLESRAKVCGTPDHLEVIQGQLAIAEKDWPRVESCIANLLSHADLKALTPNYSSIRIETLNKVTPLWTVLRPLESIAEAEKVYGTAICELLDAATRDRSYSYLVFQTETISKLVANKSLNDEQVTRAINNYWECFRMIYASSPDYVTSQLKVDSQNFAMEALKHQRLDVAAKMLESYAKAAPPYNQTSGGFSQIALRLMQLDDQPRYDLLWTLTFGTAESESCSPVGDLVMLAEPPAVLKGETLYEQSLQVPLASQDFPVITSLLLLAETSAKLQKSDEVIKRLQTISKAPGDEYQAMIGTVLLAAGRNDQALPIMQAVAATLTATKPKSGDKSPMPIHSAIFSARAVEASSTTPSLTMPTQDAWGALLVHSRERHIGIAGSYINRMVTRVGVDKAAGVKAGSPLKHFFSYEIPYRTKPHVLLEAMYLLKDKEVVYTSGNDQSLLMLKYPLAGDFSFQFVNERHGWGESSGFYGGVIYKSKEYNKTLYLEGLMGRGELEWPSQTFENNKSGNVTALSIADDEVIVSSNGTEVVRDHRRHTMPFIGIHHMSHVIAVSKDYRLSGNPTIPREVSLLDPELRGWGTSIFAGSMPTLDLPKPPGQATAAAEAGGEPNELTWSYTDGALQSTSVEYLRNRGQIHHVQYMRPLLEGESITYEFEFEPSKKEVHPTIGRVAILLREDGIKLRWLPLAQSLESLDIKPLHEVAVDESIGDGKPELKTGLNKVKLLAEGDRCVVAINDKPIARVPMVLDRRFGLMLENDREARITSVVLTGPWPTEVPQELMEPAK